MGIEDWALSSTGQATDSTADSSGVGSDIVLSSSDLPKFLSNLSTTHDVTLHEDGVIATELNERLGPELGTTRSQWTSYMREEFNPKLRGIEGLKLYDRMRKTDSTVRGSLRTLKTPITGATWFVEAANETPLDIEIAEFVSWNLFRGMTYVWRSILREALVSLDLGFYMFEKVWDIRIVNGEPRAVLKKLAARHPMDVEEWAFDANGGPLGVHLYDAEGQSDHVYIPIDKLAIFTFDGEAGDITGNSVLRSAYKHWYFKENAYKIDAIQKERHGIGIPIVVLPFGAKTKDRTDAINLARNLRVNEKAYAVLPAGWELMFLKLEGEPVSALETADHHNKMIYQNVLAQAMWGSNFGVTSSDAEQAQEIFYKSTRQLAEEMALVMNSFVIPQMVNFNWLGVEEYPQLKVRKLGDVSEARDLSFSLRNYIGAGVIKPDDRLEQWARETIDAPAADTNTTREVAAPQQPKQSTAGNQKIGPSRKEGAPSGNSR